MPIEYSVTSRSATFDLKNASFGGIEPGRDFRPLG